MILPDANPITPMRPGSPDYALVGLPMLVAIGVCLLATIVALLMPSGLRGRVRLAASIIAVITGTLLCPLTALGMFAFSGGWRVSYDAGSTLAALCFPAIPILGILWPIIAREAERPLVLNTGWE